MPNTRVTTSKAVGVRSADVALMSADWDLISALLGGTKRMRDEAGAWLPREPRESLRAWNARVSRAVLFPFFEDTVDDITNKPFEHAVNLKGATSELLDTLSMDVDAADTTLHTWSENAFKEALTWGSYFALADLPVYDAVEGRERTKGDELNEQPYFVGISAIDVIGWQTVRTENGVELDHFRYIERHQETESVDEYADNTVEYVKVIKRDGTWERWRQKNNSASSDKSEYIKVEEGTHGFGRVPVRALVFGKPVGFIGALPPLRNLAWMNLRHFQSDTDQENILHFARVPFLHYAGGDSYDPNDPAGYGEIVIGPNRVVRSRNHEAKLEHVEHSGSAIMAGAKSLEVLESNMKAHSNKPMQEKASTTATGRIIDADSNDGSAKTLVRRTEQFIYGLMSDAAEWKGETLAEDFAVDIFDDFSVTSRPDSELSVLQNDRARGDIDHETYITELRRRGVLAADADHEVIASRLANEIPSISGLDDNDDSGLTQD